MAHSVLFGCSSMAAVASTAAAAATLRLGETTSIDSNLRRLKKREKLKNRFPKDDFPGSPPFLDRPHKPIDADIIEGAYLYTNKCGLVFQATFECGGFGNDDDDLCLFRVLSW